MDPKALDGLAEQILGQLFVPLEVSGRHVHLTSAQAKTLFGHSLTPKRYLSQPGQFLSNERLTLRGRRVNSPMWLYWDRNGKRRRWKSP